jgi:hypothetical protein
MTRYSYLATAALFAPSLLTGAGGLSAPDITVGRNLQVPASVILPQPPSAGGLQLTITSGDPARVTFAAAPDQAGSASITLVPKSKSPVSPEFWVHGLADQGSVTYTIAVPGMDPAKGTVTLSPSGIVIVGPFRLPSFPTTPRGTPSKLTIVAARLDNSRKVVEEQQVAGGLALDVTISNSSPEAGAPEQSKLRLAGGASTAATVFKPAGEGSTTLTPVQPAGFSTPAELASVIANVDKPGVAITDEFTIGKDLQTQGVLCLGEAAPEGGTKVTLTSSDPKKLVLSSREDELGSGVLILTVPAGKLVAPYYLQALGDAGTVTYKATAEGFRHRVAKIGLAPSGFIVAYSRYGPPDEATVLRKGGAPHDERRFYPSLAEAKERPIHLAVYSVYLDPASGMAADITVQALRPGVSATVALKSSNPEVGSVESPLLIKPGMTHAFSRFTPVVAGETIISIDPPRGFSTPKNATSAPATVMQ